MTCYFCKREADEVYGTRNITFVTLEGESICEFCAKKTIFVFGSNLAGRHGKGAALDALKYHGAKYGQGEGLQGESYGLPTKDHQLKVLSLTEIKKNAETFAKFAADDVNRYFRLTRVGCGNAGFVDRQIAPMFKGISPNVLVPRVWRPYIFGVQ